MMPDPRVLSTVFDSDHHWIERFAGNKLIIRHAHGSKVTPIEYEQIAAWYWRHVAIREPEMKNLRDTGHVPE